MLAEFFYPVLADQKNSSYREKFVWIQGEDASCTGNAIYSMKTAIPPLCMHWVCHL